MAGGDHKARTCFVFLNSGHTDCSPCFQSVLLGKDYQEIQAFSHYNWIV